MNYRDIITIFLLQIFSLNSVLICQDIAEFINYDSYKFNEFVNIHLDTSKSENLKIELGNILLARLQKDKRTYFDDIITIADLHIPPANKFAPTAAPRSTYFFNSLLALTRNDKILYGILKNKFLKYWYERHFTTIFVMDIEASKEIQFEELMVDNTKLLDKKRMEYIYDYLTQCYELGTFYFLGRGDRDLYESYYVKIVSYPIQLEPNKDLRAKLYELYYQASLGLMKIRQKNLERLERTFFIGPEKAKLERRRDYYINKLKK